MENSDLRDLSDLVSISLEVITLPICFDDNIIL